MTTTKRTEANMLALTRRQGERVIITVGDVTVEVEVTEIRGCKVVLGFTAPREIPIHREEVQKAIESGIPKKEKS